MNASSRQLITVYSDRPSTGGRDFIKRRLSAEDKVIVHTYGHNIHGRYVGDVFLGKGNRLLNRECIKGGVAAYVDTNW